MKGTLEHGKIGVMLPVNGTRFSQRPAGSSAFRISLLPLRMHLVITFVYFRSGRERTIPGKDDIPLINPLYLPRGVALGPLQGLRI